MISERDIEQVLSRADIVEVVERCMGRLGRGNKACCPFHNERTPSFHVNPRTQTWHCFGGCPQGDNGGDVINFVMKYKHLSFPEAVKDLAHQYGITIEETHDVKTAQQIQEQQKRESMLAINQWAGVFYAKAIAADNDKARFALNYAVEKRGWGAEYVSENGIGYADGQRDSLYKAAKTAGQPIELMVELDEGLDSFVAAVSRNDIVNMRLQAENAYQSIDKLAKLEAPEALADVQKQYVDGTEKLREALDAYIALYSDMNSGSFDQSTYDKRVADVQKLYDEGVAALEEADKTASGKE